MKVVCETSTSKDAKIRKTIMESLVKIMFLYYQHMMPYMQALLKITFVTIQDDVEPCALQAIEFWATISEIEIKILSDLEYSNSEEESGTKILGLVNIAVNNYQFVELLLSCLVKQKEDQKEDDWNLSSAAANCLVLVSKVVGNAILEKVVPFIQKNIMNTEDWHFREAAILSFGAILEGPDTESLKKIIQSIVPPMLQNVQDKNTLIKDTSVFCIGKIAKHHFLALNAKILLDILKALTLSLKDDSMITSKACWTYHHIFEAVSSLASTLSKINK
jgi:importin subunit beta-1